MSDKQEIETETYNPMFTRLSENVSDSRPAIFLVLVSQSCATH